MDMSWRPRINFSAWFHFFASNVNNLLYNSNECLPYFMSLHENLPSRSLFKEWIIDYIILKVSEGILQNNTTHVKSVNVIFCCTNAYNFQKITLFSQIWKGCFCKEVSGFRMKQVFTPIPCARLYWGIILYCYNFNLLTGFSKVYQDKIHYILS